MAVVLSFGSGFLVGMVMAVGGGGGFLVAVTVTAVMYVTGKRGYLNGGDYLVIRQGSGERPLEEIFNRDGAGAVGSLYLNAGFQSGQDGAPIGGRVGVGNIAGDGSPVTHLGVANTVGRLGHHGVGVPHSVGRRNFPVSGQRSDADGVAVDADALQFGNAANIY